MNGLRYFGSKFLRVMFFLNSTNAKILARLCKANIAFLWKYAWITIAYILCDRDTNKAKQSGLDGIIKLWRLGLFVHVACLHPEVPATPVLAGCCAASDDTPPQRGWRRPRGRRRNSWLHQVCTDLNLPTFDALNLALDRTSWRAVATAFRSRLCDDDDDDDDEKQA